MLKDVPDAEFLNTRAWYLLVKAFSKEGWGWLFGEKDLKIEQKLIKEIKKKNVKKKEAERSYIRFDVKVQDITINLDTLAIRIFKEVSINGFKSEHDYNLELIAFGIAKLVISSIIEDDKASSEDIIEQIMNLNDGELVQSVDIFIFNKVQA